MNAETTNIPAPKITSTASILLLGDDGRMRDLLIRRFAQVPLTIEMNILNGIIHAANNPYSIILINTESVGEKINHAAHAIRQVAPNTKIILYGDPYSEIFSRKATRHGADDYLIWPIPSAEIISLITTAKQPAPGAREIATTPLIFEQQFPDSPKTFPVEPKLLNAFQELAALVPNGISQIAQRATELLPELLNVQWVKIALPKTDNTSDLPTNAISDAQNLSLNKSDNHTSNGAPISTRSIPVTGNYGIDAKLILGPIADHSAHPADQTSDTAVTQTADFLGILFELAQRDQSLKRLAIIDELTGAHNRRYLEYFLRQVIEQGRKERTEVTLLLFDIDDFKHYNDTYGHAAGDEILREATRLIKLCCRQHDVVARIGGDEFAVLFWDTGQPRQIFADRSAAANGNLSHIPQDAQVPPPGTPQRTHQEISVFLSNRFRRIMRTTPFPSLGPEARGVLTISGGLASFPWDGDSVEELLAKADDALLTAKRGGKNRIYLVGQP